MMITHKRFTKKRPACSKQREPHRARLGIKSLQTLKYCNVIRKHQLEKPLWNDLGPWAESALTPGVEFTLPFPTAFKGLVVVVED